MTLQIRPPNDARWDLASLGEVMLRLDPGEDRVSTAHSFVVHEGGGEYNVAKGVARLGLRATVATAFVDNPVGQLAASLIRRAGVDGSHIKWADFDGIGRQARVGLNFTERGFGARPATSTYDRGHSAASQMASDDVDLERLLGSEGVRWFHTGGVFAALSASTATLAKEAMQCAKSHGTVVSYDLNYRASMWRAQGGQASAQRVNRDLVEFADVLVGNEEDFTTALGFDVEGLDPNLANLRHDTYAHMMDRVTSEFPHIKAVATTLRSATTASTNDWGAIVWSGGKTFVARHRPGLEIFDRTGGGDAFIAGLAYALMVGLSPSAAVDYGAAHGALVMTTVGDGSASTLQEVERLVAGANGRIQR